VDLVGGWGSVRDEWEGSGSGNSLGSAYAIDST
jgi:hypothetical protein